MRNLSLVAALALIVAFFGIASPEFLSPRNLSMLAIELSITATLALGMLLVLLPGQIDLSVGSGVGLLGGIASVLVFQRGWPAPAAMGASLALGVLLWHLMGRLIVGQNLPPFIVTLGGLMVFKGLFWLIIGNSTIPVVPGGAHNLYSLLTTYYLPPAAGWVLAAAAGSALAWTRVRERSRRRRLNLELESGELFFLKLFVTLQSLLLFVALMNQFRGIPLPVLLLAATALAVGVLTRRTVFGRHLYAVGGNVEAAFISGVPVERTIVRAFTVMGAVVAATGFLQTAYAGASTTTVGELMELDAVAACVIGGTSLRGGRGSAAGVLIGALIMAALLNGMTLLAVSPEFKFIARGCVLTLAVWMDSRFHAPARHIS